MNQSFCNFQSLGRSKSSLLWRAINQKRKGEKEKKCNAMLHGKMIGLFACEGHDHDITIQQNYNISQIGDICKGSWTSSWGVKAVQSYESFTY